MIKKFFENITPQQQEQFAMLTPLYEDWTSKINVVSRKDIDKLQLHHVLHSLAIAKFAQMGEMFAPGTKIMDVGTGGGFPGIPLAVIFPHAQFTLCDSIGKKIIVVANLRPATLCGVESNGMVLASGEETVRVVFLAEDTPLGERVR